MTHNVAVFLAYGESKWVQMTALSFLSLHANIPEGTPRYQSIVYTDKPRHFKAWFNDWVKIRPLDSEKLRLVQEKADGLVRLKRAILDELVEEGVDNILFVDSDQYHLQSALIGFNHLEAGHVLLHSERNSVFGEELITAPIFGFNRSKWPKCLSTRYSLEEFEHEVAESSKHSQKAYNLNSYSYHFYKEMDEKLPQVQGFFDRHYYRDVGELFTLVKMWTPDKWHLSANELPTELI